MVDRSGADWTIVCPPDCSSIKKVCEEVEKQRKYFYHLVNNYNAEKDNTKVRAVTICHWT